MNTHRHGDDLMIKHVIVGQCQKCDIESERKICSENEKRNAYRL